MTIPTRSTAILDASTIISAPHKYALIDLETTGVKANDQAVEIAILSLDREVLFHSLLKPSVSLSPKASAAHGWTMRKLAEAPIFADIYEALASVISGKVLVAYNANYDRRILAATCEAFGLEPFANEFVCAMGIKRQYNGDAPGELRGDHTAVGDCMAMAAMLHGIARTESESAECDKVTPELLEELETLQARIKLLEERRETIRAAVISHLATSGNECYQPGNGLVFRNEPRTKYSLADGMSVEDIDPAYLKATFDVDALNAAYDAGKSINGIEVTKNPSFVLRRPKIKSSSRRS